jgi:hypothetical protein
MKNWNSAAFSAATVSWPPVIVTSFSRSNAIQLGDPLVPKLSLLLLALHGCSPPDPQELSTSALAER